MLRLCYVKRRECQCLVSYNLATSRLNFPKIDLTINNVRFSYSYFLMFAPLYYQSSDKLFDKRHRKQII